MALCQQAVRKRFGHHSLVVVRDHQGVETPERRLDSPDQRLFQSVVERLAALAVHAHDLLVMRDASATNPFVAIPAAARHSRIARAGSSSPTTPNGKTLAPSAARFAATFPAPPSTWLSFMKSTTGTGASGESRVAEPQT